MNFLSDTWHQVVRGLRTQFRIKVFIFINLVQPVLWLLLFPQIFKSLSGLIGISYLELLAPGVVVMTVLFGSAWSGMGMLHLIDMGILSKMLATPVSRVSIIVGVVISSMVVLVMQAIIIFIVAIIMGVDVVTGAPGVFLAIFLVILLGLGFAGFSNGLALLYKRAEPLMGTINFVTLPLMLLSSIMMLPELLPGWLDTARQFNPVDYAVVGVRGLVLTGYDWSELWLSLVILAAWAAAGIGFGTWMFRVRAE